MVTELEKLSWPEAEEAFKEDAVAILPVGSIEGHGAHLPLGTDTVLAYELARRAAEAAGAILLPPIYYTYTYTTREYPGTIDVAFNTLKEYVKEVCRSLARHGVRRILIVNGHGGNREVLRLVSRELLEEGILVAAALHPEGEEAFRQVAESEPWRYFRHADEFETSMMLHLQPGLVRMDRARGEYPEPHPLYPYTPMPLRRWCRSGVFGDPTKASEAKGRRTVEAIVKALVRIVENLRLSALPEGGVPG